MTVAEKIVSLRSTIARVGLQDAGVQTRVALGHRGTDACLHGGLLKGALHEVFPMAAGDGAAAAGFVTVLAARVAGGRRLLWLRPDFAALEYGEIAAPGLLELGLDPDRFLLLRVPDVTSLLRAGFDALSCTELGALVLEIPGTPRILDLAASRRFVLGAAQSGVTVFLLRWNAEAEPSAAETRWLVRAGRSRADCPPSALRATSPASGGGNICRGRTAWDWGYPLFEAELVRNRHGRAGFWVMEWNCDDRLFRAANPGAVVSPAADRPAAAENASRIA